VKGAGTKEEGRPAKLMIQEWKDKNIVLPLSSLINENKVTMARKSKINSRKNFGFLMRI
jgi:hypothetical protein